MQNNTNAHTLTAKQATALVTLFDTSIAATIDTLWAESDMGGTIMEYEDAFEAACDEHGVDEGAMNEAIEMRDDAIV
jgi:hypothetical protein